MNKMAGCVLIGGSENYMNRLCQSLERRTGKLMDEGWFAYSNYPITTLPPQSSLDPEIGERYAIQVDCISNYQLGGKE